MHKYFRNKWRINIFIPSIANLKCTPSDKQMYPQGYMHPRLGAPVLYCYACLHPKTILMEAG